MSTHAAPYCLLPPWTLASNLFQPPTTSTPLPMWQDIRDKLQSEVSRLAGLVRGVEETAEAVRMGLLPEIEALQGSVLR